MNKAAALFLVLAVLAPFWGFWIVALIGALLVILPVGAIVLRYPPRFFGIRNFVNRHGFA